MGASSSGRVCKKCNSAMAADRRSICNACFYKARIDRKDVHATGQTRWKRLRTEAFSVIGNRCWRCRRVFAKRKLQLHYLHYGTVGKETLEDVLLLCQHCHVYKHREMKAARKRAENLDQS